MKQHLGLSGFVFGGTAVLLATQPVWAAPTQVTGVRLNPNGGGVQLILETQSGDRRPQIFTVNRRNAFVADITNTQVRLPQGSNFRQDNPAPGISSIVVTQLDNNSVRVIVSGVNNPPTGQVADRAARGITFNFSPASADAAVSPPATAVPAAPAPTAQIPPGQTPDVLVPNPPVTVEGAPPPAPAAGTIQPVSPAPPFLPRAVAPPVGDIAVSELDPSGSSIDLGTGERIPRLLLRDAPVREVLSLLARAAGRNVVFIAPQAGAAGQAQPGQAQPGQPAATTLESTISLDIENEPLQDVFNYVLRITGLEANRNGNTIFVGSRLPDVARNVIVRSLRLNQVPVTTAANFLTAQGAETQLPIERVQIQTIGEGAAARTVEIREPDIKVLRAQRGEGPLVLSGLSVLTNDRLNSITLVGDPRKVEIASSMLSQLDARRRQVAVNVKVIDINLLNVDLANASFSFGIGRAFFSVDNGAAVFNYGGFRPPTNQEATGSLVTPTVISNPLAGNAPFLDVNNPISVPGTSPGLVQIDENGNITGTTTQPGAFPRPVAPFGPGGNPLIGGITEVTPATPSTITTNVTPGTPATPDRVIPGTPDRVIPLPNGEFQFIPGTPNQVIPGNPGTPQTITRTVQLGQPGTITTALPSLFQFPSRLLGALRAQITNGNAKILTDPTLVIQEGETANVNVGQEVITNLNINRTVTGNNVVETVTAEKGIAGLSLQVQVNRIDDNGFVSLAVNPTVSAPFETRQFQNTAITLLSRRDLRSGQIRLRDGQTLILSGIIQDQDRTTISKVPILGDIPILGALFRSTNRQNQRQEVIVLLTPQVIDDSSDASFGYRYRPSPPVRELLEQRGGLPGSPDR